MPVRVSMARWISALALLAMTVPAFGQEVVVTGPPPELRRNLDAFQKAFNTGNADQFEAMAKTTFTPESLKRETAADRKKSFLAMHASFGTIAFTRVERTGPDAPLQVFVKGSVASGVMWIDLDDASRIDRVKPEVTKKTDANRRH